MFIHLHHFNTNVLNLTSEDEFSKFIVYLEGGKMFSHQQIATNFVKYVQNFENWLTYKNSMRK